MEKSFVEPHNKAVFTAGIRYGTETVRKLMETQYGTFHMGRKLGQMVIGLVLICVGAWLGTKVGVAALALGCIVVMSLNLRPRMQADEICRQYNGSFPNLRYSFTHTGFRTQQIPEEVSWGSVARLIDDGVYLYIFDRHETGYMVDRSTVKGSGGADALKAMLVRKTGLEWKKPSSVFKLRFRDLRDALSGSDGYSGERLDDRRR